MNTTTIEIKPIAPYNFELTAGTRSYFKGSYILDHLGIPNYRRLLQLSNKLILCTVTSIGTVNDPKLSIVLTGNQLDADETHSATEQVRRILGCDQDLSQFYDLVAEDEVMSRVVKQLWGLHIPLASSIFESFILAILGQQIANNVATIIRQEFIEAYGTKLSVLGDTFYCFPTPDVISDLTISQLRKLKLSERKAEYVIGIAKSALDHVNGINTYEHLSDKDVIERCVNLRGIGHWTANWVMVNGLGRFNGFPSGDLALQRIISESYFSGVPQNAHTIDLFSQRWSPWRTYATTYLFAALRANIL